MTHTTEDYLGTPKPRSRPQHLWFSWGHPLASTQAPSLCILSWSSLFEYLLVLACVSKFPSFKDISHVWIMSWPHGLTSSWSFIFFKGPISKCSHIQRSQRHSVICSEEVGEPEFSHLTGFLLVMDTSPIASKGTPPVPSLRSSWGSKRLTGKKKKSIPSNWTSRSWDQTTTIEPVFETPSKAISVSFSSSSSSEPASWGNSAFLALIPCSFDADSGMADDAWLHGGCWFFIPWSVFSQTLELLACNSPPPSLLVSPLHTPPLSKKTKGNWQAAGQGKLSYIISPLGSSLCCLYLKAIIFYISWHEFSSTHDP